MAPVEYDQVTVNNIGALSRLKGTLFQTQVLDAIAVHLQDLELLKLPELDKSNLKPDPQLAEVFRKISECVGTEDILEEVASFSRRKMLESGSNIIFPEDILHPKPVPNIGRLTLSDIQPFVRLSRLGFDAQMAGAKLQDYIRFDTKGKYANVEDLVRDQMYVAVLRSVLEQQLGSDRVRTMGRDPIPENTKLIWVNGGDLSLFQGVEKVLSAGKDILLLPLWLPQSTSKGNLYYNRLSVPLPAASEADVRRAWTNEISDYIQCLYNGEYVVEERPLLKIEVFQRKEGGGLGEQISSARYAINEIVCMEGTVGKAAHYEFSLDPESINVGCCGNGIIVTTGTGRQKESWFSNDTDPHLIPDQLRDVHFPLAVYKVMSGRPLENQPLPGLIPSRTNDPEPLPYNIIPLNGSLYVTPLREGSNEIILDDTRVKLELGQIAKISMSDERIWIVRFPTGPVKVADKLYPD